MLDPYEFNLTIPGAKVRANRLLEIEADGQSVLLTRLADSVYAFNALCPHQLGNLARGSIYRGQIECPVHGWRFDIRTGQAVYPLNEKLRLRQYEANEENGQIILAVSASL